MEFAFILDPLDLLKAYKDTSVSMMRGLQARGATLFAVETADLFWTGSVTQARVRPITLTDDDHDWFRVSEPLIRPLTSFDAVVMRKDPPFDMEYVYSTYLLEAAEKEGALVINRPRAVRDHNEKMAIIRFPEFTVETRGNLAVGGKGVVRALTARDREIAESVGPRLAADGLFVVGIDVIGDYLTEVNVTSPTGFVEITKQTGFDVAGTFADALEARVRSRHHTS